MTAYEHLKSLLTQGHQQLLDQYGCWREPDFCIMPDGTPYIYRWYLVPRNEMGNVYFHVQVASDPERPLHDHPWANTSIILAGGYDEILPGPMLGQTFGKINETPRVTNGVTTMLSRRAGDVIHRSAEQAHRVVLRAEDRYSISLFTTGPKTREWGFWVTGQGGHPLWVDHRHVIEDREGRSVYIGPKG